MFKVGDRVVCINNTKIDYKFNLYYNKIYIITSIDDVVRIKIDNINYEYFNLRFISLKEYRKQKLNNLKNYEYKM